MATKDDGESAHDFEYILLTIGTKGRLNKFIFIACSFTLFVVSMTTFSYGFLGFTPPYWCHNEALASNDWTMEERRNLSIPFIDGEFDNCKIHDVDYSALAHLPYSIAKSRMNTLLARNVSQKECTKREFNSTTATTVTEWDLVCERRVLYSTTQSVIQIGFLIGSIIIGYLADRFGRKRIITFCTISLAIFAFCTIFSPNVWIFILLRLITSALGMGICNTAFIYCIELSLPSERSFTGCLFSVPWGIGVMVLSGIAYLVRPWYYLQVALFIPTIVLFFGMWTIPESPRWLITNSKYEEAYQVLERISKSNNKTLPDKDKLVNIMKSINSRANTDIGAQKKSALETIKDTFRRIIFIVVKPQYRRQSLVVFFCWFSVALIYYGVSLGSPTPNEASNSYLYMFLGGILEVVAFIVLWPISEYFGRKKSLFGFYAICSTSILSALLLITFAEGQKFIVLQWILFLVGKFAIASAFQLIWLFTAELYPTNYRSIAVGEASTVARAGSIFSSYINDLLVAKLPWAPAALFGSLSAMAAFSILLLRETTKVNLPEFVPSSKIGGYDNPAIENNE